MMMATVLFVLGFLNPDRAEEYFCRGCHKGKTEDIEFYDENNYRQKRWRICIRLEK